MPLPRRKKEEGGPGKSYKYNERQRETVRWGEGNFKKKTLAEEGVIRSRDVKAVNGLEVGIKETEGPAEY